jgi:hypothetical protein
MLAKQILGGRNVFVKYPSILSQISSIRLSLKFAYIVLYLAIDPINFFVIASENLTFF